jgi:hypothetical protein
MFIRDHTHSDVQGGNGASSITTGGKVQQWEISHTPSQPSTGRFDCCASLCFHSSFCFDILLCMWLKGVGVYPITRMSPCCACPPVVIERRLQREPHAVGRAARLQLTHLRRNVWNSRSSYTGAFRIATISIVISQFLPPGRPNPRD